MIDWTFNVNSIITLGVMILGFLATWLRVQWNSERHTTEQAAFVASVNDLATKVQTLTTEQVSFRNRLEATDRAMQQLTDILQLVVRQDERINFHTKKIDQLEAEVQRLENVLHGRINDLIANRSS